MPREILTPGATAPGARPDGTPATGDPSIDPAPDAPFAGFFGKLPQSGDFLSRGLSPAFRRAWDGWVTRHLTPFRDAPWPPGGIRFRLVSGGRVAAGVAVPSQDDAGRRFPLSLILVAPALPPPPGLDPWCDAALAAAASALAGAAGPDDLWAVLADLPPPPGTATGTGTGAGGGMALWRAGSPPQDCPPGREGAALRRVFDA